MSVAVLFARQDSCYKAIPGTDVFDIERDARTWGGGTAVVAHPPCRAWGRLRQFAKPRADERALAHFAIDCVRRFGGVLEHPECSTLWAAAGLPRPRQSADSFGGWTLCVDQNWWGHLARKRTWLYIVGVSPSDIPVMPLVLGLSSHVVSASRGARFAPRRPTLGHADREHSPPAFAGWLVDLARLARRNVGVLS